MSLARFSLSLSHCVEVTTIYNYTKKATKLISMKCPRYIGIIIYNKYMMLSKSRYLWCSVHTLVIKYTITYINTLSLTVPTKFSLTLTSHLPTHRNKPSALPTTTKRIPHKMKTLKKQLQKPQTKQTLHMCASMLQSKSHYRIICSHCTVFIRYKYACVKKSKNTINSFLRTVFSCSFCILVRWQCLHTHINRPCPSRSDLVVALRGAVSKLRRRLHSSHCTVPWLYIATMQIHQ